MKVLVVEDNEDIAQLLGYILDSHGVEVQFVTNHFETLFEGRTWEGVDVALVDLMLPVYAGTEVLRWLQKNFPSIRRVAMTAGLPAAGEAAGLASHMLLKPFSTESLLEAITK